MRVTSVPGPVTSIVAGDLISVNGTIRTPITTATGERATTTSGAVTTTGSASASKTAVGTSAPSALGNAPASGGAELKFGAVNGGVVALVFGALIALL